MTSIVVNGASIACSFGTTPAVLVATPSGTSVGSPASPIATVLDVVPITNIPTFGMCTSPSNPAVQAATTAASGVFTPAPCVPATGTPWAPPATAVTVGGVPAVLQTATCRCAWLGMVSVSSPGQVGATGH